MNIRYQSSYNNKSTVFTDRSCQEKSIMIAKLIGCSADILDSIWSPPKCALSTTLFIREILVRTRTTYSMLQLALFYIFRIKKLAIRVKCGRRMFVASLMLASKYLYDKNYKNRVWAKLTGLDVKEVNATERYFLYLIDYQLYVPRPIYDKWVQLLHGHIRRKYLIDDTSDNGSVAHTLCHVTMKRFKNDIEEYHQPQKKLRCL